MIKQRAVNALVRSATRVGGWQPSCQMQTRGLTKLKYGESQSLAHQTGKLRWIQTNAADRRMSTPYLARCTFHRQLGGLLHHAPRPAFRSV